MEMKIQKSKIKQITNNQDFCDLYTLIYNHDIGKCSIFKIEKL